MEPTLGFLFNSIDWSQAMPHKKTKKKTKPSPSCLHSVVFDRYAPFLDQSLDHGQLQDADGRIAASTLERPTYGTSALFIIFRTHLRRRKQTIQTRKSCRTSRRSRSRCWRGFPVVSALIPFVTPMTLSSKNSPRHFSHKSESAAMSENQSSHFWCAAHFGPR